mmetsp:Transcript_10351/g.26901  ORF Transcript_10351/g.26901 Transcript_10351/m.26901 type:complete len:105 (-) Transcript_10351:403-717(-)
MKLFILALFALIAQACAYNAPMRARAGSSVRMSASPDMNRRAAAFAVLGGLAAITTGAEPAKADKPTWAEIQAQSPFFSKSGVLNSVPKVKGVLLQSTPYAPKN